MLITSVNNDRIKDIIKLKDRKTRKLEHKFIIEGEHLVEEAIKNNIIDTIIIKENYNYNTDLPCFYVSENVMDKLTDMDTSCNIIAVCNIKEKSVIGTKILMLDDIQDPGNLGTIVRSAMAFNVDTIILSPDTVDIYNPKVLRATQGMVFNINIVIKDLKEEIINLKNNNITIYGTSVNNGESLYNMNLNKDNYCLIMGNEGNGVKPELLELCDKNIYIDMNESVESLNVGVATSIILYELNRKG
jgi:TrmH family RNA methyltransferase